MLHDLSVSSSVLCLVSCAAEHTAQRPVRRRKREREGGVGGSHLPFVQWQRWRKEGEKALNRGVFKAHCLHGESETLAQVSC